MVTMDTTLGIDSYHIVAPTGCRDTTSDFDRWVPDTTLGINHNHGGTPGNQVVARIQHWIPTQSGCQTMDTTSERTQWKPFMEDTTFQKRRRETMVEFEKNVVSVGRNHKCCIQSRLYP